MLIEWTVLGSPRTYFEDETTAKEDGTPPRVRHQVTFYKDGRDHGKIVRVSIPPEASHIEVTGSGSWLDSDPWEKSNVLMDGGTPGVQYSLHARIMHRQSHAILEGVPLVAYKELDKPHGGVSAAALCIIRRLRRYPTGMSVGKKAFIDRLFEGLKYPQITPVTAQEKFNRAGGYLKFDLQPGRRGDKLNTYIDPLGQCYCVVGGCHIHRLAPSILRYYQRNGITGLMLDTTWSVMQYYVTGILVGISLNTAVPSPSRLGLSSASNFMTTFLIPLRSDKLE
jgi:hypothetical protein